MQQRGIAFNGLAAAAVCSIMERKVCFLAGCDFGDDKAENWYKIGGRGFRAARETQSKL